MIDEKWLIIDEKIWIIAIKSNPNVKYSLNKTIN